MLCSWLTLHSDHMPEYVVLDLERENRVYEQCLEATTLNMVPIEDGDIYRMLLDLIQIDRGDLEQELDMFALEALEELARVNDYPVALRLTNAVRDVGYRIYQQCRHHRLYYQQQLCYGYYRLHAPGVLYLKKHHPDHHVHGSFTAVSHS